MTVTALAHEARIGKSQLSKYENGHERPKVETLAKLLEVLKVEPLWFFYLMHQLSREQHAQALRIDLFTLGIPGSPVSQTAAEGFNRVLESLFGLHAIVIEERITQMNGPVRHHEGWTPG